MAAIVEAVFIGGPRAMRDQRGEWTSSIARSRAFRPVRLSATGFDGDQVTQPYHGGPDAACCVHVADHYAFWSREYGVKLAHGYLGENVVLNGLQEADVCAGDVVRVGSALLQVSGPRIPCDNQARRVGRPDWVKLTIRENRTGFYLRVLESGVIQEGDSWTLQERLNDFGSIPAINRCFYLEFGPDLANAFADMSGLADWWRNQFREKAARTAPHWSDEILHRE